MMTVILSTRNCSRARRSTAPPLGRTRTRWPPSRSRAIECCRVTPPKSKSHRCARQRPEGGVLPASACRSCRRRTRSPPSRSPPSRSEEKRSGRSRSSRGRTEELVAGQSQEVLFFVFYFSHASIRAQHEHRTTRTHDRMSLLLPFRHVFIVVAAPYNRPYEGWRLAFPARAIEFYRTRLSVDEPPLQWTLVAITTSRSSSTPTIVVVVIVSQHTSLTPRTRTITVSSSNERIAHALNCHRRFLPPRTLSLAHIFNLATSRIFIASARRCSIARTHAIMRRHRSTRLVTRHTPFMQLRRHRHRPSTSQSSIVHTVIVGVVSASHRP